MTASQQMEYAEEAPASFSDILVSMLAAIVLGSVVWAGGYGTVAAINFAGDYFQIGPPTNELLAQAIQIGYVWGPILAGVLVAFLSYRWVLRLK